MCCQTALRRVANTFHDSLRASPAAIGPAWSDHRDHQFCTSLSRAIWVRASQQPETIHAGSAWLLPVASHWRIQTWMKWCCGRTTLHICSKAPKQDLIVNDFDTPPKQGLIAHDSCTSIKLDLTRLGLCIHVFITSPRAPRTARGLLIVVSHLESTDPRLHCLSPWYYHMRRISSLQAVIQRYSC